MALCLECKADYLPHITVCPACGLALLQDPMPRPALGEGFVPFLTAGYPEGMAAAASLEAAGLETRITTMNTHVYLPAPMHVTVLVRERDLDAAATALRRPPLPQPVPEGPHCVVCGAPGTVHETARRNGVVSTIDVCPDHVSERIATEPCTADEDVIKPVEALNARKGVRTVCSCSGSHPGAGDGFISISPSDVSTEAFDAFVNLLRDRVAASELTGRVKVEWSAEHGAEITLIDRARARETWDALARLIALL